jgi:hypothetical protein
MVGDSDFLKPHGPESGKEREYGVPAQRQRIMNQDPGPAEPSANGHETNPGCETVAAAWKDRLGDRDL